MTKRVFSDRALAHQWAHDGIEREYLGPGATIGRGGSTYYVNTYGTEALACNEVLVFFSYSTVIAWQVRGSVAPPLYLLDTTHYSPTTNKHQYNLRDATRNMNVIELPLPAPHDMAPCRSEVMRQIETLMRKAVVARTKKDQYVLQAALLLSEFNRARSELIVRGISVLGVPEIDTAYVTDVDHGAIRDMIASERAIQQKLTAERTKHRRASHEAYATHWRSRSTAPHPEGAYLYSELPTPLRLSLDGENIETARHAEIPVKHAKRLWPVIQMARGQLTKYRPLVDNAVGMKLGVYTLNAVNNYGDIIVGCHDVAYTEMAVIAEQLGLTEGESA